MGAMLSNDRRTWLGHVKYLPRGMARGHCCHQRRPTVDAALGIIIDHSVRRRHLPQSLARMSLLPAAGLARRFAQTPGPRRLLQSIARRRLAAVAAVEAEPTLQLRNPVLQTFNQLLKRRVLCPQLLDLRC